MEHPLVRSCRDLRPLPVAQYTRDSAFKIDLSWDKFPDIVTRLMRRTAEMAFATELWPRSMWIDDRFARPEVLRLLPTWWHVETQEGHSTAGRSAAEAARSLGWGAQGNIGGPALFGVSGLADK
jgi:hypothetical protein